MFALLVRNHAHEACRSFAEHGRLVALEVECFAGEGRANLGMVWVAGHLAHGRGAPLGIDVRMTGRAGGGADVVGAHDVAAGLSDGDDASVHATGRATATLAERQQSHSSRESHRASIAHPGART